MGAHDALVQSFFHTYILPLGLALLGLYLARTWLRRFLIFETNVRRVYADGTQAKKEVIFANGLQTQCKNLDRPLRILELGVKDASNFHLYPNGCDLVCLDYDPLSEGRIKRTLAEDYPNVRLLDCLVGGGDVLTGVGDACLDAIVFTYAMKDEVNPGKTIREIYRVLNKGGRCYFVDHTSSRKLCPAHILRIVSRPLYFFLGIRCGLDHDMEELVRSAPFKDVSLERVRINLMDTSLWQSLLVPLWTRWNIVGVATK